MLKALQLNSSEARTSEDVFVAESQWMPTGRVFGGQVLGLSIVAASRTTPTDRLIHSLHGYFLRPGDVTFPITISVDRIHDGRSFSTRRTQAYQNGQPIFSCICSFQTHDPGLEHETPAPEGLPGPDELPSDAGLLGSSDHPGAEGRTRDPGFEIRRVPGPVYFDVPGERIGHQAVWARAAGPMPDDEVLHRAAIAYASDFTILEPITRPHGVQWTTPGIKLASLDHAMWWHRPARADEWLLYVEESPSAQGGRGLSTGRIYQDGRLVASVAQEGMIRVPQH